MDCPRQHQHAHAPTTHPPPCLVSLQVIVKMPRKTFYRARAHSNPLNANFFQLPLRPEEMDWCASAQRGGAAACRPCTCRRFRFAGASTRRSLPQTPLPSSPTHTSLPTLLCRSAHYPELCASHLERPARVHFADVGCGFGGLTVRLAEMYPDKLVLGMELRDKVTGSSLGGGARPRVGLGVGGLALGMGGAASSSVQQQPAGPAGLVRACLPLRILPMCPYPLPPTQSQST